MTLKTLTAISLLLIMAPSAWADTCSRIRLATVSWTDIKSTTAVAHNLLDYLGYSVSTTEMDTVPQVFDGMAEGRFDAFLGYWRPSGDDMTQPYLDAGDMEWIATNLEGAQYTLAVPRHVYEAGVQSFGDIADHASEFRRYFHGLESGAGGNDILQQMIDDDAYGLGDFRVMPTPERVMLPALERAGNDEDFWMVFLAWSPHPMNRNHDFEYLSGDDEGYFASVDDPSTIETLVRRDFMTDCPNAGQLLSNLQFSLDAVNAIMDGISADFLPSRTAALNWMGANPDVVAGWLEGVNAVDPDIDVNNIPQQLVDRLESRQ